MTAIPAQVKGRRELILAAVSDLASAFLYYDRKGDEELRVNEIEDAIEAGDISIDEIVGEFRRHVEDAFDSRAANRILTPTPVRR